MQCRCLKLPLWLSFCTARILVCEQASPAHCEILQTAHLICAARPTASHSGCYRAHGIRHLLHLLQHQRHLQPGHSRIICRCMQLCSPGRYQFPSPCNTATSRAPLHGTPLQNQMHSDRLASGVATASDGLAASKSQHSCRPYKTSSISLMMACKHRWPDVASFRQFRPPAGRPAPVSILRTSGTCAQRACGLMASRSSDCA